MSPSVDLQTVIYQALIHNPAVARIVVGRVFDNVPSAAPEYPYISFGPSDFEPSRPDGIMMRTETFQIDCWTNDNGKKRPARELADAVYRALHDQEPPMADSGLVRLRVVMVRILDDPSGKIAHGVVTVEATIEEG